MDSLIFLAISSTSPAPSHTSSQAREGGAPPQSGATPPGEDASLPQVITPLPSQPTALLPSPEDRGSPNPPNTPTGQTNLPTNNLRQGSRQPPRQRATQASQEVHTTSREGNNSTTPPVRPPKVLLKKNLTLSGSLTFPTNP